MKKTTKKDKLISKYWTRCINFLNKVRKLNVNINKFEDSSGYETLSKLARKNKKLRTFYIHKCYFDYLGNIANRCNYLNCECNCNGCEKDIILNNIK